MRLHTNTHTITTLAEALGRAKVRGHVAMHVHLPTLTEHGSNSKRRAFELRLGTTVKVKGDGRTFWNSGTHGADQRWYSGTYDEWGWFLAEVFAHDPEARTDRYDGREGFNAATKDAYLLDQSVVTEYPRAG